MAGVRSTRKGRGVEGRGGEQQDIVWMMPLGNRILDTPIFKTKIFLNASFWEKEEEQSNHSTGKLNTVY